MRPNLFVIPCVTHFYFQKKCFSDLQIGTNRHFWDSSEYFQLLTEDCYSTYTFQMLCLEITGEILQIKKNIIRLDVLLKY